MPKVSTFWTSFSSGALDFVYPKKCSLCGRLGEDGLCVGCRTEMPLSVPQVLYSDSGVLAYRASLYRYTGRSAQAVKRLKYSRSTALARPMAELMASGYSELLEVPDAIVPVPIHWTRRSMRGFNQAELLCRLMPPELVFPSVLKRVRATRPQVGLSADERLRNLDRAFAVTCDVSGLNVLLVDDVLTSGQTARECARVLLEAGAREVGVFAFAGDLHE